jgi:hypothetical protein
MTRLATNTTLVVLLPCVASLRKHEHVQLTMANPRMLARVFSEFLYIADGGLLITYHSSVL